jgi:hypothetical protein
MRGMAPNVDRPFPHASSKLPSTRLSDRSTSLLRRSNRKPTRSPSVSIISGTTEGDSRRSYENEGGVTGAERRSRGAPRDDAPELHDIEPLSMDNVNRLTQAVRYFDALGDRVGYADASENLGSLWLESGRFADANRQYLEVAVLYDELGIRHIGGTLLQALLANTSVHMGAYERMRT